MALIDQTVLIAAPVEQVWEYVHDASRRHEWDVRITRCNLLTDGPVAEGTRLRYSLRWLPGFPLPLTAHYAAFVPRRRAAIAFDDLPWWQLIESAVGAWHFRTVPEGTQFRSVFHYRLKCGRVGNWLDRTLFDRFVARETRRSLAILRRNLETG